VEVFPFHQIPRVFVKELNNLRSPRQTKKRQHNTMQHFRGKKAAFLKAFRQSPAIAPAADKIGVNRCTIYRWMEADHAFAEAVEDARQAAIDDLEAIHFEKARDRDTLARIHILRSRRGNIYGDRSKGAVECQPWQPEPLSPEQMKNALRVAMDSMRNCNLPAKSAQEADAEIVTDTDTPR